MTKCDFTMTPCPKGCKDANEVIIKYFRKELEEPGREYQCQDCGLKDKYRVITGPYEDECEKKMVSCVSWPESSQQTPPHQAGYQPGHSPA